MPLYDYVCCNEECLVEVFEAFTHMNEMPFAQCPGCNECTPTRLISGGTYIAIKGFQTLGSIADRNRKQMGQYLYDKKMKEKEERAIQASNYVGQVYNGGKARERSVGDRNYTPPWRSGKIDKTLEKLTPNIVEDKPTKIDIRTAEEAHRYIMTGKKGLGSGPPTI
jgi:putative FmdB family regulatory protein